MAKVVVVFHSGYGHTQRLAQETAFGADAELLAIDADGNLPDGGWATLDSADAIVFGSPTYMGSVSQNWKDKVFGGFTVSANINGDKASTLQYFVTLAMQHGGVWAGTGILYNNTRASQRSDVNYLGSNVGPMAQVAGDASAEALNPGDLETARLYGERIAALAQRFAAR